MSHGVPSRPLLIGHRGASGYRPEHTESAYRLAFLQGVDAVEPDLVATSDGVLVLRHENEISGTTDVAEHPEFLDRHTTKEVDGVAISGWFTEDFTWEELSILRCRERIPELRPDNASYDGSEAVLRFEDLLALIDEFSDSEGREVDVVIELKHVHYFLELGHDLLTLTLEALKRCGWSDRADRLVLECFELGVLERAREAGFCGELVFLLEHRGAPADELALLGADAATYDWYRSDEGLDSLVGRVDGISLSKQDLLRFTFSGEALGVNDTVERAHQRGFVVYTWTLRPENRYLAQNFRASRDHGEWGDWQAEWKLVLSTGVDGVFLDHPDLLSQVL